MTESTLVRNLADAIDDSSTGRTYRALHGIESLSILTVIDDEKAHLIAEYLRPRIEGKVIVEIGAGIGVLACHLADVARKVYAIEADPTWTGCFLASLYERKPPNLTFIFGTAEEAPPLYADVALFCTHSGQEAMYRAASRFAPTIIDVYGEIISGSPKLTQLLIEIQGV